MFWTKRINENADFDKAAYIGSFLISDGLTQEKACKLEK